MRSRYDYRKPSRNYFLYIENARGPSSPSFLHKATPSSYRLCPPSLPSRFHRLSRRALDHATTFFYPLDRAFNRARARPLTRRSQDDLSKLSHFAVHFAPRDVFAKYSWYSFTIRKIQREIESYNKRFFFLSLLQMFNLTV